MKVQDRFLTWVVCVTAIVSFFFDRCSPVLANDKIVQVGTQKQLFVDDYVVAEKDNVTLEVGQAKKYGVVFEPTLPWEFQAGVVHDGPDGVDAGQGSHFCCFWSPHWNSDKNIFQMWYMGTNQPHSGLAYAESKDGFHWTKPKIAG